MGREGGGGFGKMGWCLGGSEDHGLLGAVRRGSNGEDWGWRGMAYWPGMRKAICPTESIIRKPVDVRERTPAAEGSVRPLNPTSSASPSSIWS